MDKLHFKCKKCRDIFPKRELENFILCEECERDEEEIV
jgi:Zn finger protein HypA/HybF involved in hydrogenase expression